MAIRKRFIAGAKCPSCQAQDTLAMWRENNIDIVECVKCGHQMREADKEAREHVRKEEPMQAPVYAAYHQDSNFPVTYCKSLEKRQQKSGRDASISPKSLLETFCLLYPLGPTDQDIWVRAGGDLSRIKLEGSGRLAWSRAIRDIEKGSLTTAEDIVRAANEDYPQNKKLLALLESLN